MFRVSDLTKVSEIMSDMGLTQPDGLKAMKLRYCTAYGQCPCLLKDGKCGYARAKAGPHKGEFQPIEDVDPCPMAWETRGKEVAA